MPIALLDGYLAAIVPEQVIRMSNIFAISDTHWSHVNFLKFTDAEGNRIRPFDSIEEIDEMMVENWNKTVGESDIVYHLGDVYFGHGYKYLERLKGRKRLILGNHDDGKCPHLQKHFQKITVWRMFPEFNCLLTHVPVDVSSLYKVKYNLHGHIHQQSSPTPQHINCCVEMHNYTPKPIEELVPKE